jgi:hypothetical protein
VQQKHQKEPKLLLLVLLLPVLPQHLRYLLPFSWAAKRQQQQ